MGDGDENGYPTAYATRWGKLVVLDSHDIEDNKCVQRAVELQPQLIVNPCQIPAVKGQDGEMLWSSWRVSLESTNHRLEYIAHTYNIAVIRCDMRSEEHTSELQSLMRISYAVFCLKKK